MATELAQLLEAFVMSAVDSPSTRRAYRRQVSCALERLRLSRASQITAAHLAAFRAQVVSSGLSPASQAQAVAAMRAFLTWLHEVPRALPCPLDVVRTALRIPRVETLSPPSILDEEEIRSVLELADIARGDRALVTVLLGAGLRVAEACALDCADLFSDTEGMPVLRVRGKGRKERLVPVRQPVLEAVAEYLEASGRSIKRGGPIFLSHDSAAGSRASRRLSDRGARRRITELLSRAGITKPVRTHGFRHTFSTFAVRNGCHLAALKDLLGHSSISTTIRYTDHLGLGELREAVPASLVGGGHRPSRG